MPRHRKEPHLVKRKARYDQNGRLTHKATWIIKDGDTTLATGSSYEDFEGAQKRLHEYNVRKHSERSLPNGAAPHEVVIGDLITFYLSRKQGKIAGMSHTRRREFLREVERINDFWGARVVADINEETSLKYQRGRNQNVVRKELAGLRAIVNFGELKGKLDKGGRMLDYMMPPMPNSRIHFYERGEVAQLVWAAYRSHRRPPGYQRTVHIARFILAAVYTGTRSERLERASFIREPGRPWLDLERGIFYRKAAQEMVPTNKRADPVRIPRPLLSHMRRWHRGRPGQPGARYLVEYDGRSVCCKKGFESVKSRVLEESRASEVNRHTLRHTCATWLMQAGVSVSLIAKYLSTRERIIEEVYGHHHPDFHSEVDYAFSQGRAGRTNASRSASPQRGNALDEA